LNIIRGRPFVRSADILGHPSLGLSPRDWNKPAQARVGSVLRALGWTRVQRRIDGKVSRVFQPKHEGGDAEVIDFEEFKADYGVPA
jgi:hypothetical protein